MGSAHELRRLQACCDFAAESWSRSCDKRAFAVPSDCQNSLAGAGIEPARPLRDTGF
jgi:hypothetical protein